jgi:fatty acid CoA ligase FadD36
MDWGDPAGRRVTIAGRVLGAAELHAAAAVQAGRIAGAGSVGVFAQPTVETVVVVLAGLLAGVAVVPIPPGAGTAELRHVLTDSDPDLVLRQAGDPELPVPVATAPVQTSGQPAPVPAPAPSAIGLILYTSGTTGPPKGARIPAAAIAADLDALADAWAWTPEDTLVHGLPLYHVHGLVLGVLGALRVGCDLVHTGRPDPARYAAAGGTLYFGVPTVWSRLAADPASARALRPARLLVSGSAALPAPVFDRLRTLTGHAVVERYGMTETLITVSARADGPRTPGAVGTPLAGVDTRVVCEPGETIGELQVRGSTLFDGYLGRPEATAEAYTPDGWFRTGDAATIDADGTHRIVGRLRGDLIKSGGYRIGAGEVEDALLAHPAVREAAVVGRPHEDLGEEIVAYVIADGGTAEQTLIDHVATSLARHKRPRRVVFVDQLPRNAMGKLQKQLL